MTSTGATTTDTPAAEPGAFAPESGLDYARLDPIARERGAEFASALPFPHIAIDDFLEPTAAERVWQEFETRCEGWDHYVHYNENKLALTNLAGMPPHTRALVEALLSERFVRFVAQLTGNDALVADPELDGAGLHRVPAGGFLNVHTDFLSHTVHHNWLRKINLLLYFNKDWQPEWDGALELWEPDMSRCVSRVEPLFNRCVLFHTTDQSFHGHPRPLRCPDSVERRSVALYYFQIEAMTQSLTSTHYRSLPTDPLYKKVLVAADRTLLRAYSFVRRHTGLSDGVASRLLRRLFGK